MRYYMARELRDSVGNATGLFHYTVSHNEDVHPVGYCAGWTYDTPAPRWMGAGMEEMLRKERERALPFREKFHTNGHRSRDEACGCYRAFLLDLRTTYDGRFDDRQEKCLACHAWTQGYATVEGTEVFVLCDAHRDRGTLETLYHGIGERWRS